MRVLFDGAISGLGGAGFSPERVHTTAAVTVEKVGAGFKITKIVLKTEAKVPGIDAAKFQEIATATRAVALCHSTVGTPIELEAKLM